MSKKDIKLAEIKKHNPTLLSKVKSGDISLQEAHNIVQSEVMKVSEMKGQGTKSNKITLEQEFQIINKRYKPSLDEWIELLKKEFPFTHKDKIK
jgi:polyhydroxyalkanoate synthesis regulator phasin